MNFYVTIKDEKSSTKDHSPPKKLNSFPNPASNIIFWNVEDYYIQIYIRGVQLMNGYSNSLDLINYPSGLYLLKVGNEVDKVVKKKGPKCKFSSFFIPIIFWIYLAQLAS